MCYVEELRGQYYSLAVLNPFQKPFSRCLAVDTEYMDTNPHQNYCKVEGLTHFLGEVERSEQIGMETNCEGGYVG